MYVRTREGEWFIHGEVSYAVACSSFSVIMGIKISLGLMYSSCVDCNTEDIKSSKLRRHDSRAEQYVLYSKSALRLRVFLIDASQLSRSCNLHLLGFVIIRRYLVDNLTGRVCAAVVIIVVCVAADVVDIRKLSNNRNIQWNICNSETLMRSN